MAVVDILGSLWIVTGQERIAAAAVELAVSGSWLSGWGWLGLAGGERHCELFRFREKLRAARVDVVRASCPTGCSAGGFWSREPKTAGEVQIAGSRVADEAALAWPTAVGGARDVVCGFVCVHLVTRGQTGSGPGPRSDNCPRTRFFRQRVPSSCVSCVWHSSAGGFRCGCNVAARWTRIDRLR